MILRGNERLLIGRDPQEAARMAADAILKALAERPRPVSIALAGGSTPALLYATLAQAPYRDGLPWQEVNWFWADERAVPPDHPDSNYRMAAEKLLGPMGIPPERIRRMPADRADLDQAAAEYERTVRQELGATASGIPVFSLILLGVGPDGHTASLFPGTPALYETQRLVVANYAPTQKAWRMTMTYPLLKAARETLFFVIGKSKADILAQILAESPADLPVAALRNAPGHVTWVLDADAAEFEARSWDRQTEQDVAAGRLDRLAEEAIKDLRAGRGTDA